MLRSPSPDHHPVVWDEPFALAVPERLPTFPALSVARIVQVCFPPVRPDTTSGLAHGSKGPPSTLHSVVTQSPPTMLPVLSPVAKVRRNPCLIDVLIPNWMTGTSSS